MWTCQVIGGIEESRDNGSLLFVPLHKEWYYEVVVTGMAVAGIDLDLDCKEVNRNVREHVLAWCIEIIFSNHTRHTHTTTHTCERSHIHTHACVLTHIYDVYDNQCLEDFGVTSGIYRLSLDWFMNESFEQLTTVCQSYPLYCDCRSYHDLTCYITTWPIVSWAGLS